MARAPSSASAARPSDQTDVAGRNAPAADESSGAAKPRRYRGQDPDERRAQRRRRLLDAGLELFGTAGYQSTSVEKLCSTSGVTGRHFYEEFPSREALLSAVLDDVMADVLDGVTEAVAAAPAALEPRLMAGIGTYIRGLTADPRRARIVALEIVGVSPEFEQHRRELGAAFAEYFRGEARALIEAGEPLRGDTLTMHALLAAIHELSMVYLTVDEPIDVQDVVDEAVRIVRAVALSPSR